MLSPSAPFPAEDCASSSATPGNMGYSYHVEQAPAMAIHVHIHDENADEEVKPVALPSVFELDGRTSSASSSCSSSPSASAPYTAIPSPTTSATASSVP